MKARNHAVLVQGNLEFKQHCSLHLQYVLLLTNVPAIFNGSTKFFSFLQT